MTYKHHITLPIPMYLFMWKILHKPNIFNLSYCRHKCLIIIVIIHISELSNSYILFVYTSIILLRSPTKKKKKKFSLSLLCYHLHIFMNEFILIAVLKYIIICFLQLVIMHFIVASYRTCLWRNLEWKWANMRISLIFVWWTSAGMYRAVH